MSLENSEEFQGVEQILNRDTIPQSTYKNDFEKLRKEMQEVMNSSHSISIKSQMLQGILENLKTKFQCLTESNQDTKNMIISMEKISSHSSFLQTSQRWKEINHLTTHLTENNFPENQETRESLEYLEEEDKMIKEMKHENERMEELIVNLKQTRNSLLVGLENSKDGAEEYQHLYQVN